MELCDYKNVCYSVQEDQDDFAPTQKSWQLLSGMHDYFKREKTSQTCRSTPLT